MRPVLSTGERVEAVLMQRGLPCDNLVRLSDGSCWLIGKGSTRTPYPAAMYALIEAAANAPRGTSVFDERGWDWYSFGVWGNVKTAFEEAA